MCPCPCKLCCCPPPRQEKSPRAHRAIGRIPFRITAMSFIFIFVTLFYPKATIKIPHLPRSLPQPPPTESRSPKERKWKNSQNHPTLTTAPRAPYPLSCYRLERGKNVRLRYLMQGGGNALTESVLAIIPRAHRRSYRERESVLTESAEALLPRASPSLRRVGYRASYLRPRESPRSPASRYTLPQPNLPYL